jgi:putative membrane protein
MFELASRQAALAFARTLIAIDQALLSAVRTSLSLLAFGFAMVLFLHRMSGTVGVDLSAPARNFGFGLIALGVALITVGLIDHRRRFNLLKNQMDDLCQRKLLAEPSPQRHSALALLAYLLLLSGILVMLGVAIRIGPFA